MSGRSRAERWWRTPGDRYRAEVLAYDVEHPQLQIRWTSTGAGIMNDASVTWIAPLIFWRDTRGFLRHASADGALHRGAHAGPDCPDCR